MKHSDDGGPPVLKYAQVERERRWLVDPARRPDLSTRAFTLIEDRYIVGTRLRLRRMTNSETGDRVLKLTKKYDSEDVLARPIVTAYLTVEEFAVFEALPATPLAKRRYRIADGDIVFSVDQFIGPLSGLELAEIERPDAGGLRAVQPPPWIVREVSADPGYQGGTLCNQGLPKD